MQTEIILTEDGSHTLFVPEINECYHSTHGAIQESRYIFIEAGLKQCDKKEINILEIGFGTGLNAFLTLIEAINCKKSINYKTLELYPVKLEAAIILNYPKLIDVDKQFYYEKLHTSNWGYTVRINDYFKLEKLETDFTIYDYTENFDVIYFDAFSPEKQPEIWELKQFKKLFDCCNEGAIITTYCAKGKVRRAMQQAGFKVERLAGPPGKREILRGTKL